MSVTVAYLGPAGTFTEAALWEFAHRGHLTTPVTDTKTMLDDATSGGGADLEAGAGGSSAASPADNVIPLPCTSPREAISALRAGDADYAVVAIENSVDGFVTPTFDALDADGIQIYAELDLPIAFAMMMRPGMSLSEVTTVTTHPVAYQQVKTWLADTIGEHTFVPASSNAAAAQIVADGGADLAAAPVRSAELFHLTVVAENIADVAGARTRVVVVGPTGMSPTPTGVDRTAVVFTLRNEPGSLVAALTEFAVRGVDLSRIESRPIENGLGTYRFHVDLNGHVTQPMVAEALRALYVRCESIKFLGSWPAAPTASERERQLHHNNHLLAEAESWVSAAQTGRMT